MQQGERLPDSLEASTVAMVINVQISIRLLSRDVATVR